jgi:lipid A disaccharide synthetase
MFNTGFSKKSIQDELNHLMHNNPYINQIQHGYQEVIRRLGGPGASDRAAKIISSGIREKISQS